jgi:AcrR family transcriptional regulator
MAASDGDTRSAADAAPRSDRRSGRRPGVSGTRADIIRAARKVFAESGYRGATMRAIAHAADVDAALIHHFFVSKEGVFAAAIEDAFLQPAEVIEHVLSGDHASLGERLVRNFLQMWDNPQHRDPLLAVFRSALSYDEAAKVLGGFVTTRFIGRIVAAINAPEPELRANLIGTQLVGLAIIRFVIKVEPIASADSEVLVKCVGGTVQNYLSGELNLPAVRESAM